MAKPRVFVSSTCYDLKHIRASLEIFIRSLGFEPILSERGDVTFSPDVPLDESCYREIQNCDVYVLIIGGRYGSEVSSAAKKSSSDFYERYQSITRQEHKSAAEKNIPVFILIEKAVYAEYQTFKKNRDNKSIIYAHVDSVNVFEFIDYVMAQPRNNPVYAFEYHSDIEAWLREQWAGLFRELINRMSGQQQLASLQAQVDQLAEMNKTFKTYLEELLSSENPAKSKTLIEQEHARLQKAKMLATFKHNELFFYLTHVFKLNENLVVDAFVRNDTLSGFVQHCINKKQLSQEQAAEIANWPNIDWPQQQWRTAREAAGLPVPEDDETAPAPKAAKGAKS